MIIIEKRVYDFLIEFRGSFEKVNRQKKYLKIVFSKNNKYLVIGPQERLFSSLL